MSAVSLRQHSSFVLVGFLLVLLSVVVSVPAMAGPGSQGNQRPLSDWLDNQGTTSVFFPPVPDLVGQGNCDDPPIQPLRFSLVDYTGHFNEWIKANGGPDLGTTVTGQVTEQALADGRARVHVVIHTRGALTTVWCPGCTPDPNDFPGPLHFGRSAAEVADGASGYVLGDFDMNLTFINTAPSAPLPNLVVAFGNLCFDPVNICPEEGVEVEEWRVSARAIGELRAAFGVPDGTRGHFLTSQTGLFNMPPHGGDVCGDFPDVFPVETMFLQRLGR